MQIYDSGFNEKSKTNAGLDSAVLFTGIFSANVMNMNMEDKILKSWKAVYTIMYFNCLIKIKLHGDEALAYYRS
jgi:hypothetical protein